jgi:hypothetical protein
VPASGSQTPSMAFAAPTAARHPLQPTRRRVPNDDALSGLATSTHATDRSVVSPRFAPHLSMTHGGVPTGDPDVSPDQTYPGRLFPVRLIVTSSGFLLHPWRPS